ncbi:MAG: excisionase family DNA-binding protein [Bifidobacteriaceae bacterium]|jgi:excisionase family DNA binding protein|nr:excisionase family DNA-binding protein [Bifidobacteriaceae bacterium]
MSVIAQAQTVLPPANPADLAALAEVLPAVSPAVRRGLSTLVDALSSGTAVRIEPVSTTLTTGQAAEMLGVSRMTMVKLLEEGHIAFERPRVHRVVRLEDLISYKQARTRQRKAFLQESAAAAARDGSLLDAGEDYTQALKRARHRLTT